MEPRPDTDGLRDPASYRDADLICDVVMKGGIASGVIYPLAVCEIARKYRLRNIGGTSAGAIAAAAAAAAEVGRESSGGGFARLADLPERVSTTHEGQSGSVLFNLFQPSDETRAYFRLLTAALRAKKGAARKAWSLLVAAVAGAPLAALAGAAPGLAATVLLIWSLVTYDAIPSDPPAVAAVVLGTLASLLVAIVGAVVVVVLRLTKGLLRDLPRNGFGICAGHVATKDGRAAEPVDDDFELRDGTKTPKPLTTWLADEFDALAGKPHGPTDPPLTLGDLRDAGVNLKMFSTNLTEGTPYTFPFRTRSFFFDPEVFARYFPPRVVDCMTERSPHERLEPEEREAWELAKKENDRLLPLPDAPDLPVIVMTRFSLSFPVLLSAVPLWRVYEDEDTGGRTTRECWFSDGGITSNFPIHFFDSAVPRWPTFGINLGPSVGDDESTKVWAPRTNDQGAFARVGEIRGLTGFFSTILDTMQNWMDSAQTKVPGYRDRIVLVRHSKEEGGMNLDMPPQVIRDLARRGGVAGRFLVNRFSGPTSTNEDDQLSWENHRWMRLRTVLPLLENLHAEVARGWDWPPHPSTRTYAELIEAGATLDSPWCGDAQRERIGELAGKQEALAREWTREPRRDPQQQVRHEDLDKPDLSLFPLPKDEEFKEGRPASCGAPRPRPTIRIVRDF